MIHDKGSWKISDFEFLGDSLYKLVIFFAHVFDQLGHFQK
jgi:hypothetical protein